MDRNQAKEFYPILQAFAEGRVIECRTKPSAIEGADVPNEWQEMKVIEFWGNIEYRIKPEPKYRPFANAEECWNEMLKHQPFGWVKSKKDKHYSLITSINDNNCRVYVGGGNCFSLNTSMELYTFADGTPFGVKTEE